MPHTPHTKLTVIENDAPSYAVREYIASMAQQLAQLAEREGDEALSTILLSAASLAERAR